MPTTPSPYNYNRVRYAKVPKRVKSKKGGLGCAVVALALVAVPIISTAGVTAYFV